jgi:hypothetical protein
LRHAASLPLLAVTLGTAFLAYCEIATDWWIFPQALVPALTFGALYVGTRVQRQVLGVGTGRDRYGLLALLFLALTFFLLPVATVFVGAGFFLGTGLLTLGWPARDLWLLAPGIGLLVASPLVNLGTLGSVSAYLGERGAGLVATTAVLLLLTITASVRERSVTRTADA